MLPLLNLFIFCNECGFLKEKQVRSLTKTFSFPELSLREKEVKCTMMILENYLIRISIVFLHISIVERNHFWKKWNCLAC